jgi:hypothetical protein
MIGGLHNLRHSVVKIVLENMWNYGYLRVVMQLFQLLHSNMTTTGLTCVPIPDLERAVPFQLVCPLSC